MDSTRTRMVVVAVLVCLFAVGMASGAAALNIIPDRNYTPGVKDQKLQNLLDVVALAEKEQFPVIVGTELNAPGNKFVDSFGTAELQPLVPDSKSGFTTRFAPVPACTSTLSTRHSPTSNSPICA